MFPPPPGLTPQRDGQARRALLAIAQPDARWPRTAATGRFAVLRQMPSGDADPVVGGGL